MRIGGGWIILHCMNSQAITHDRSTLDLWINSVAITGRYSLWGGIRLGFQVRPRLRKRYIGFHDAMGKPWSSHDHCSSAGKGRIALFGMSCLATMSVQTKVIMTFVPLLQGHQAQGSSITEFQGEKHYNRSIVLLLELEICRLLPMWPNKEDNGIRTWWTMGRTLNEK